MGPMLRSGVDVLGVIAAHTLDSVLGPLFDVGERR